MYLPIIFTLICIFWIAVYKFKKEGKLNWRYRTIFLWAFLVFLMLMGVFLIMLLIMAGMGVLK